MLSIIGVRLLIVMSGLYSWFGCIGLGCLFRRSFPIWYVLGSTATSFVHQKTGYVLRSTMLSRIYSLFLLLFQALFLFRLMDLGRIHNV